MQPSMPHRNTLTKIIGVGIAVTGAVLALLAGASDVTNFMIAGGCLAYVAGLIAEWWTK
jgi:hypothetical protein